MRYKPDGSADDDGDDEAAATDKIGIFKENGSLKKAVFYFDMEDGENHHKLLVKSGALRAAIKSKLWSFYKEDLTFPLDYDEATKEFKKRSDSAQ